MTESEAKTKWCPLARTGIFQSASHGYGVGVGGVAVNRGVYALQDGTSPINPERDCKCVASACMFWRENQPAIEAAHGRTDAQGFCGAAGRPWTY